MHLREKEPTRPNLFNGCREVNPGETQKMAISARMEAKYHHLGSKEGDPTKK